MTVQGPSESDIDLLEDFGLKLRAHRIDSDDGSNIALRTRTRLPGHDAFELLLRTAGLSDNHRVVHVDPPLPHYFVALAQLTRLEQSAVFSTPTARDAFSRDLELNDVAENPSDSVIRPLPPEVGDRPSRSDTPEAEDRPAITFFGGPPEALEARLLASEWPTELLWIASSRGLDPRDARRLAERGYVQVTPPDDEPRTVLVTRREDLLVAGLRDVERERTHALRRAETLGDRNLALERALSQLDREKMKLVREVERYRDRVDKVYGSTSYRIGRTLTKGLKSPIESARGLLDREVRSPAARGPKADRGHGRAGDRELDRSDGARPARSRRPVVSIIMTTYRSGGWVERSLASLEAQTHTDWELLIADDASDDDTLERLIERTKDDDRIRVISTIFNRGTYSAKNLALTRAAGEFVTFQDSDDWSARDRLAVQVEALRSHPSAVACAVNYVRVDEHDRPVAGEPSKGKLALMGLMWRRQPVTEVCGGFDAVRIGADAELVDRLRIVFGEEGLIHLKKPLYRALTRAGSLTTDSETNQTSPTRVAYATEYQSWHDRVRRGRAAPYLEFPLRRRPFACPARIDAGAPWRQRVVAGMASIPSRESTLRRAVSSLVFQVDRLHVVLNGYERVPDFLNLDRIVVHRSQTIGEFRDNAKFFGLGHEDDGVFLAVDDDLVYPDDYVRQLLLHLDRHGHRAVVGVHGVRFAQPLVRFLDDREVFHFRERLDRDEVVDLLGTGTVAFHTRVFAPTWSDFGAAGMADLWLARAAKRAEIPLVCVARPEGWLQEEAAGAGPNLYTEFKGRDDVQTRVAREAGPWGSEAWRRAVELTARTLPALSAAAFETRGYARPFILARARLDADRGL